MCNIMYTIMIVKISEVVGPDLATRNGCDNLFRKLEQISETEISLDFSGVSSIGRSFAHQYIINKSSSIKTIREVNIPSSVEQMLEFVKRNLLKKKPVENNNIKRVIIS